MSCTTPGATIHYTLDGSPPTHSSLVYSGPVMLSIASVVKAIAVKVNNIDSNTRTASYTTTAVVDRYWISNILSNWNNTSNWAATSGGSGGATVPNLSSNVRFDNNGSGSCLIDVPPTIYGLYLKPGYDSSVVQNGQTMTVVTTASFDGGLFLGDPSSINAGTVYLGSGIIQDATAYISQDVSCASTHNQWSPINNSLLIMNGSGQRQRVYSEAGGVIPSLTINKLDNTQVLCYGDSPIMILNDFIIQDGTFNTNGLDFQVGM
jgi:Fn3 associated